MQDLSRNKGLKILGVSFDRKLKSLKSFVNENNLGFEILHDKKLRTLKDFRILIIPTLFVIDKEGSVKSIYVDFDQNVKKAASAKVPVVIKYPTSGSSVAIRRIAAGLAGISYDKEVMEPKDSFIDRFTKVIFRGKR